MADDDVWARAAARAGVASPKPAAASGDDVWARAAARASGKTTAAPSADPGFQLAPSHIPQALQGNTNAPAIADMPAMSIPNGPANGSNSYVDAALKASRPGLDSKAGAASDVLRAAGSAVAPIAIGGGAIMAPLATAVGLGTGMAGQAGVEAVLKAAGAGEGTSSLGGDIAGGILGGSAAKYAGEIPGLASSAADAVKSKLPASLGGTPEWTDQHNFIMQGLRPGTNPVTFKQSLFKSMPDIKAAEVQLGKPIESIDDLIGDPSTGTPGAIKLAKQANREQYRSLFPPGSNQITEDTTPVADAIRAKITPYMKKMNPGKAAELDSMASKYEGRNSIEDIDNFLQGANGQLDSYYAKNPAGRSSAANNPDTAGHVAEAQALRKTLYGALDKPGQGEAAAELQKRYGALSDFEQAAYKRKNVAERQAPENITQQLGNVAATMKGIKGMAKLATLNPSGIVDIGEAIGGHKMANYMRELNSTNGLIQRAFHGYQGTPSPINIPPRFNPTGFAPGFEQSGFQAPPKALDAGPIRMGTPDTSGPTQSRPLGSPASYHEWRNGLFHQTPSGWAENRSGNVFTDERLHDMYGEQVSNYMRPKGPHPIALLPPARGNAPGSFGPSGKPIITPAPTGSYPTSGPLAPEYPAGSGNNRLLSAPQSIPGNPGPFGLSHGDDLVPVKGKDGKIEYVPTWMLQKPQ